MPGIREGAIWTVDQFVEKPDAPLAQAPVQAGALWNAFIVAASARALRRMFVQRIPQIVVNMQAVIAQNPFTADLSFEGMDLYRDYPTSTSRARTWRAPSRYCANWKRPAVDGAISGCRSELQRR